jgi:hypothetical protein
VPPKPAAAAAVAVPPPAPRVRAGSPPADRRSRKRLLGIMKKRDVRAKLSVGRCRLFSRMRVAVI